MIAFAAIDGRVNNVVGGGGMKRALKPTLVRGFPRCACGGPLALALALGRRRPASTLTCTKCGREVVGTQAMLDRAAKAEARYRRALADGLAVERSGEPARAKQRSSRQERGVDPRATVSARRANTIRGGPP